MTTEKQNFEQDFSFLNENDNASGFEGIGAEEQAIPFLRLAQDISPQCKSGKPEYIEGLEPGMFFNTVTKEVYGKELKIICGKFEHLYIEWPPERGTSGPIAYHTPEVAEQKAVDKTFGAWKTKEGNKLEENYMYFILIVGKENEGVCILPMKSTGIKVAKGWNRQLLTKVLPSGVRALPHYLVWNVTSAEASKGGNDYYTFKIDWAGYVDKELYQSISTERQSLPDLSLADLKQLEGPSSSSEESDSNTVVNY